MVCVYVLVYHLNPFLIGERNKIFANLRKNNKSNFKFRPPRWSCKISKIFKFLDIFRACTSSPQVYALCCFQGKGKVVFNAYNPTFMTLIKLFIWNPQLKWTRILHKFLLLDPAQVAEIEHTRLVLVFFWPHSTFIWWLKISFIFFLFYLNFLFGNKQKYFV